MNKLFANLLAVVIGVVPLCMGAAEINREQQVKAAYLFNFARFTTWPPEKLAGSQALIHFCVLEGDPLVPAMQETLHGKEIDGHPTAAIKVAAVADMRRCHVGYLGAIPAGQLGAALQELAGSGLVTVYEGPQRHREGMIRLLVEDKRLRFEVNVGTAEREQVLLSARLLGLAKVVRE